MRYILLLVLVLVIAAAGGAVWLAWASAIAPIAPPARSSFPAATIQRGARLAALGDCNTCHTAPAGAPFAGGLALHTPFGTIYSDNITPDRKTGIGGWSEAAFRRAMRHGLSRSGRQLYPAFPYDHFTLLTPADDAALYAFLMTRTPVHAAKPADDVAFPLNFRWLIAGWKLLFFRAATFHPESAQSAAWNRGAYLVRGVAHCGACHTPRNFLGAEEGGHPLAGGEVQGWYAYALTGASPAATPWTAQSLYSYLRHGWQADHGDALGLMAEVVHDLAAVPNDDLQAIATYVAATAGKPRPLPPPSRPASSGPGEALYRGACATCHEGASGSPFGSGPPFGGIDLAHSSAPRAPNPTNLTRIVLNGIPATGEQRAPIMPGFAAVLSDRQVTELATWLRSRYGTPKPWSDIPKAVQAARQTAPETEAAR